MSDDGSPLRITTSDRVRVLTFDRPGALNAFNDELYDAVAAALHDAAADDGVAVVVITGAGRAFTAGQDLGELAEPRRHDDGKRHGFVPFIEAVGTFPKPLLAAVNGVGVGVGLTMLPHCDLVFMAEGARLQAPFVRLGVTVEAANSFLLPATVGHQAAAHLLFTAAFVGATDAAAMGLVFRVCDPDALMDETMQMARTIATMPIASLVATKQLLLDARLDAVRAAHAREGPVFAGLNGGPANREALRAFREKRDPDFTSL